MQLESQPGQVALDAPTRVREQRLAAFGVDPAVLDSFPRSAGGSGVARPKPEIKTLPDLGG